MVQGRSPLDGGAEALAQGRGEPGEPAQARQRAPRRRPRPGMAHQEHARQNGLLRHERLPIGRRASHHVAQRVAERAAMAKCREHGVAGGGEPRRVRVPPVADHVAAVLDIVVQRPVDVADGAGDERVQPDPVVVVGGTEPLGEGQDLAQQRGPEQAGGAHHGVGRHEARQRGGVVAPRDPERVGQRPPRHIDDPGIGIDELGVALHGAEQRLDLVGVPAVVLIAQGDEFGIGRDGPERPFEVAVEAEAVSVAQEDEARVIEQRRHAGDHDVRRGIVRHDADPVAMRLGLERRDLRVEEVEGWLVGRHADGDARSLAGPGDGGGRRGRRPAAASACRAPVPERRRRASRGGGGLAAPRAPPRRAGGSWPRSR